MLENHRRTAGENTMVKERESVFPCFTRPVTKCGTVVGKLLPVLMSQTSAVTVESEAT